MSLPTIASATFGASGLSVTATDGTEVVITSHRILSYQASLKGTSSPYNDRVHTATKAWLCLQIANTLGWQNVDPSQITVDFNKTTGAVTALVIAA